MKTTKRYVTFYSPGTLFSETSEIEIPTGASLKAIVAKAKTVKERHGATPYGFSLKVVEEGVIKRGKETYRKEPKELSQSGMHFLTGRVMTIKDIPDDDEHRILLNNMKGNGWNAVVENTNSYRSTLPFEKDDVVVDWEGNVTARGSDYY